MKPVKTCALFFLAAVLMTGCASSSDKIASAYVSPLQFEPYS